MENRFEADTEAVARLIAERDQLREKLDDSQTKRAALRAKVDRLRGYQDALQQELEERIVEVGKLRADLAAANERAAQWEAVAGKSGDALDCIPVDLINAIENGDTPRKLFLSDGSCQLIADALRSATAPASALAAITDPLHERIADLEGALRNWIEIMDQPFDATVVESVNLFSDASTKTRAALSHTPAESLAAHDAEVRRKVLLEAAKRFDAMEFDFDCVGDLLRSMADERGGE